MVHTLRDAWLRLRANAQNPVMRRNVAYLMTGKAIGLMAVVMLMSWLLPQAVHAAEGDTPDPVLTINAVNTAWTLIAAFLVFGMQVGFVMLEAGFAREREAVNILVEGIADTCICGVLFWAIGFAFMFEDGTPFIGTHGFFLQGLEETYGPRRLLRLTQPLPAVCPGQVPHVVPLVAGTADAHDTRLTARRGHGGASAVPLHPSVWYHTGASNDRRAHQSIDDVA